MGVLYAKVGGSFVPIGFGSQADGDARWVLKAGDTMTGTLNIANTVAPTPNTLSFTGTKTGQMLNLYSTTFALGVQSSTLYFRTTSSVAGAFSWFTGGTHSDTQFDPGVGGYEMMRLAGGGSGTKTLSIPGRLGSNFLLGDSVSAGPRLRLHMPTSGEIAYVDFEGTTAGQGVLTFRSGTAQIFSIEDTVVRSLKAHYVAGQLRTFLAGGNPAALFASSSAGVCYLALYDAATSTDSLGTRAGYIGFTGGDFYINNETGNNTRIYAPSGGTLLIYVNGSERARIDTSGILSVGRTSNGAYYTDPGSDLRPNGQAIITTDALNVFPWLVRMGAALAASQRFLSFRTATSGAGSEIGTITIGTNLTSVVYNTTSHGPFKGNVTDLDDDEAIERLMRWRPVAFQWKLDAEGRLSEEGEPTGEVEHGFIAQEMNEVNPNAVTPGTGTWADELAHRELVHEYAAAVALHAAWLTADLEERGPEPAVPDDPGQSPFQSWQGDWTGLVPDLAAAVQALVRRVVALEAAAA